MVIFISDLHLTDGTFDFGSMVHDTSAEAFKMFWDDILRIVEANASEGFNIKKIQVVLLGDILELRTTARWMNVKTRPWSEKPNQLSNDGVNILSEIIDNIIFKDTKNKILRERSYYLSTNFLDLIDKENGTTKPIMNTNMAKIVSQKVTPFQYECSNCGERYGMPNKLKISL